MEKYMYQIIILMMSLKKGKFFAVTINLWMTEASQQENYCINEICGEEYDRKFNDPEI